MIVRVIGPFQTPVKGYGKLASCAECVSLSHAQGHSEIYEIVVWNNRIMLCERHVAELGTRVHDAMVGK